MAAAHGAGRVNVALAIHPAHAFVPVHTDGSGSIVQEEVGERLYVLREGVRVDMSTLDKNLGPGPDRSA